MVIKEMKSSHESKYIPVAVIDDDDRKKGNSIMGVKVLGNRRDIPTLASEKAIENILIAIPTIGERG